MFAEARLVQMAIDVGRDVGSTAADHSDGQPRAWRALHRAGERAAGELRPPEALVRGAAGPAPGERAADDLRLRVSLVGGAAGQRLVEIRLEIDARLLHPT